MQTDVQVSLNQVISSGSAPIQVVPPANLYELPFPQELENNTPISKWKIAKIVLATILFPVGLAWIAARITVVTLFKCMDSLINVNLPVAASYDLHRIPRETPGVNEMLAIPSPYNPTAFIETVSGAEHVGAEQMIFPAGTMYNSQVTMKPYHSDIQYRNPLVIFFEADKKKYIADPRNCCTPVQLQLHNQPKLDALICWASQGERTYFENNREIFQPEGKWVVIYQPNAGCYESNLSPSPNKDIVKAYKNLGYNVLLFNYRGVMNSEGYPKTASDLITDGHAPIEFLKSRNVQLPNILTHGVSLGGGIAAIVSSKYPGVNHVNIHSFSSISKTVQGMVYGKNSIDTTSIGTMVKSSLRIARAKVIQVIVAFTLEENGWEIDAGDAWKKITGHKWIVTAGLDSMIRGPGQLVNQVETTPEQRIIRFGVDHNTPFHELSPTWQAHVHHLKIAFPEI